MKLASEIISQQQSSFDSLKTKRDIWDKVEKLTHGQLNDLQSASTKSQVFDHRLSTLLLERSHRVMSQLPVGKVRGMTSNDAGDAKLKNLLLEKYVIPNANAQFDFLTKMRLVDYYSNQYGNFFTLTDWDVKKTGYTGPDVWLLNIRDVFPQVGAVSLSDSDQIIIRTWRPISYFENLKKSDGFKNVDKIITLLKDKSGSKQTRDSDAKSKRGEDQYPEDDTDKGLGYYEVLTRFERDRWVDVCTDADLEFRDIANPHDNGELPVDCKYSIPLLDDFMGMGDVERGGSMQMVINSVWNLYLDAVKMSIFPPMLINKDNIASMSSIKWGAAAKWLVRNQINNAAQPVNLTPQGIQTFNSTFQAANASILNLFGTSDTTVTKEQDTGYGRTPQALQMQQARENTRDNADRFYMEQYLTSVMKKMVNLLKKKQSSEISLRMFPTEIEQLARDYPEVKELYDETDGSLRIPKGKKKVLYDYEIVSGSTFAQDQKMQGENLSMLLGIYRESQTPQGNLLVNDLRNEGFNFKFGELFKRVISNSGIQDWDKILVEMTEQEKGQMYMDNDRQTFMNAMAQMGGVPIQPGPQGAAPEDMGGMQGGMPDQQLPPMQ